MRFCWFFIALVWLSSEASLARGAEAFSILLPQCPAPAAVHVHALDLPLASGSALTARYEWDFGDTGTKYNTLVGWNAAHIYDKPGTYTISLKITDEAGQSRSLTKTVTIEEDKRPSIWVSHIEGNDLDDGSDMKHAVQTFDRAMELARSNCRILFHRGGTFESSRVKQLPVSNVLIGAFGEGERPLIKWSGQRTTGFFFLFDKAKSHDVVIENLVFDTPFDQDFEQNIPSVASPGGQNFVLRNCEFRNVAYVLNGNARPTGVLVQDNSAPLPTGVRAYLCWIESSDWTILGNTMANSTREHCIRSSEMTSKRILISQNNLSNIDRSNVDKEDNMKTTINIRAGSYAYIAGNKLSAGTVAFGPTSVMNDANSSEWIVLDSNRIEGAQVKMSAGAKHIICRNNIVRFDQTEQFVILPRELAHSNWTIDDISIVQNTGIVDGVKGKFLKIYAPPPTGTITLANNLFVAPKMKFGDSFAVSVDVRAGDLKGFKAISDNVWPDAPKAHFVNPDQLVRGFLSPDQWKNLPPVRNDMFENVSLAPDQSARTMTRVPTLRIARWDNTGKLRVAETCVPGAVEP